MILFTRTRQGRKLEKVLKKAVVNLRKAEKIVNTESEANRLDDDMIRALFSDYGQVNRIMFRISTVNERI